MSTTQASNVDGAVDTSGPASARELLARRLAGLGASLIEIHDDSAEHAGHAGNTTGLSRACPPN